jgi:hypothetical protein
MPWCGCMLAPLTIHPFYKRKERIYIAQVLGLRHKQIGEKSASVLFGPSLEITCLFGPFSYGKKLFDALC